MTLIHFILGAIIGSSLGTMHATAGTLVCLEGKAFVKKRQLVTGCQRGEGQPYYASLVLVADSNHGGTIDFTLGWSLPQTDPQCDNPRGWYVFHHLPLPIEAGEWQISEEGQVLGKVSFRTILPCRILGDGPIIQLPE
jgi:hypothetical protein